MNSSCCRMQNPLAGASVPHTLTSSHLSSTNPAHPPLKSRANSSAARAGGTSGAVSERSTPASAANTRRGRTARATAPSSVAPKLAARPASRTPAASRAKGAPSRAPRNASGGGSAPRPAPGYACAARAPAGGAPSSCGACGRGGTSGGCGRRAPPVCSAGRQEVQRGVGVILLRKPAERAGGPLRNMCHSELPRLVSRPIICAARAGTQHNAATRRHPCIHGW